MTRKKGQKDLSVEMKMTASQFLLANSKNGKPFRGKMKEAAASLGVSRSTIAKIWAATKKSTSEHGVVIFKANKRSEHRLVMDLNKFKDISYRMRSTYRRIAREMGVSKSLVSLWFQRGTIRAHTSAIKPDLTAANKLLRLKFSLSALQVDRLLNKIMFVGMYNTVHIDEKWFYITKTSGRYYLGQEEEDPYRSCKSKRYITKLMFMCAVARPIHGRHGEVIFDGKLGIFPFVKKVTAKRNSRNRVKGTVETKPIDSITKEVVKNCLINQVIPAIKAKWPSNSSKDIFIQQDNAKPHIKDTDPSFRAAANSDGFNIHLVCQPANSPDTNINDLGWFRAIQSLQDETASYSIDDLIKNVIISYEKLTSMTLNKVFLSLQQCMIEIMKCKGHNAYKLPHMNMEKHIREGTLPVSLQVDEHIVRECINYLRQPENTIESSYDVDSLFTALDY